MKCTNSHACDLGPATAAMGGTHLGARRQLQGPALERDLQLKVFSVGQSDNEAVSFFLVGTSDWYKPWRSPWKEYTNPEGMAVSYGHCLLALSLPLPWCNACCHLEKHRGLGGGDCLFGKWFLFLFYFFRCGLFLYPCAFLSCEMSGQVLRGWVKHPSMDLQEDNWFFTVYLEAPPRRWEMGLSMDSLKISLLLDC